METSSFRNFPVNWKSRLSFTERLVLKILLKSLFLIFILMDILTVPPAGCFIKTWFEASFGKFYICLLINFQWFQDTINLLENYLMLYIILWLMVSVVEFNTIYMTSWYIKYIWRFFLFTIFILISKKIKYLIVS